MNQNNVILKGQLRSKRPKKVKYRPNMGQIWAKWEKTCARRNVIHYWKLNFLLNQKIKNPYDFVAPYDFHSMNFEAMIV